MFRRKIGIADEVGRRLDDPNFILPLRLESFRKVFGIGELQYVDFEPGWASGLVLVLEALERQDVTKANPTRAIDPKWEVCRRIMASPLLHETERLTSNWLRILELPDRIRLLEPLGAVNHGALKAAAAAAAFPMRTHGRGVIAFLNAEEATRELAGFGRFVERAGIGTLEFAELGLEEVALGRKDASSILIDLLRGGWEGYARRFGLKQFAYSKSLGFHVSEALASTGKRIPWGRQGERRSSMLRNVTKGHKWSFGVSATPSMWPLPHLRLKARVLYSTHGGPAPEAVFEDVRQQFKFRRAGCKGWRNKQWHGRLRAFLELLSGESAWIDIPLSPSSWMRCDAEPMLFSAPVTTVRPDDQDEDNEDEDETLTGSPAPGNDEDD